MVARVGRLKSDRGWDVADGGLGDVGGERVEMVAVDGDFSTGHGCERRDAVEVRGRTSDLSSGVRKERRKLVMA